METRVTDNPAQSRYEIFIGVEAAPGASVAPPLRPTELAGFADYFVSGDEVAFTHTEIDPRFGGRGLGGRLTHAALDAVRERGLAVLPYCSFIRDWIAKHPEYVDLVPEDRRDAFGL
ncbi:N-acetyltransferase (plasmid) [Embleya sp. NBC_00888]|uniref:GNAT family N-acetyltransferase n=1 Tax=Embleya sp. NBC_00888 TaxID=2975960 RepID=UPI002F918A5A|nr:N-acetyltransferase [Embleya sp. NBC_00888]